jgi:hypothetical protein
MTPLTKILLSATGLLLVLLALRETPFLDFNHYLVVYKSSLNSNLSSENTTVTFEGHKPEPKRLFSANDLSFIVILGKDTLHKEIHKLEPIVIYVDSLQSGPVWMPFYKSAKFSAVAVLKLAANHRKDSSFLAGYSKTSFSGRLKLSGTIKITGICSRKEAGKLIRNFVAESFTTSTKKFFSNSSLEGLQSIALNKNIVRTSNEHAKP